MRVMNLSCGYVEYPIGYEPNGRTNRWRVENK